MSSVKTTRASVMKNFETVIGAPCCALNNLLWIYSPPIAYTEDKDGWCADVFRIDSKTCIVEGHKAFGTYIADDEICEKYNNQAKELFDELYNSYNLGIDEFYHEIDRLLYQFVIEAVDTKQK